MFDNIDSSLLIFLGFTAIIGIGYYFLTNYVTNDEDPLPVPHGEAADALEWVFDVYPDTDPANRLAFLEAWHKGQEHVEWPEYTAWLEVKDLTA